MDERQKKLIEKAKGLPLLPGVYIMKDKSGGIIYIGKAKALKNRVSQYFRVGTVHEGKVAKMLESVWDFEYIVTDNELESLVLECSLIKLHSPKYNILLKDDKGYRYIKISKGPYSKITSEKQKHDDEADYLGPYMSGFVTNETVDEVNRTFQLPTCKRSFPGDFGKMRPCLNYHIGLCMGVCTGKISEAEYNGILKDAVGFLKNGSESTVKSLKSAMEDASEKMEFEKAAKYRDRITAIEKSVERQKIFLTQVKDADFIGMSRDGATVCFVVLKFRSSHLCDKESFLFEPAQWDSSELTEDFVIQYYNKDTDIPKNIYLPNGVDSGEAAQMLLSQRAEKKVKILVPQKGELYDIIHMASQNAAQLLSHHTVRTVHEITALNELQSVLGLGEPPSYIEAYDISNIGSSDVVAGMVVFENARPLKKAYKKFAIKTVSGQDDYASMREVISRRFARYQQESGSEGFGRLPDLILVDGGKTHVSTVLSVLKPMGIHVPVFGMVKDSKHKTRGITADGGEITINPRGKAFSLITTIQEEVHRFAITYQAVSHTKRSLSLTIEKAPGIGPERARQLLKHFGTLKAIRSANIKELSAVKGMTSKAAASLHEYLESES